MQTGLECWDENRGGNTVEVGMDNVTAEKKKGGGTEKTFLSFHYSNRETEDIFR